MALSSPISFARVGTCFETVKACARARERPHTSALSAKVLPSFFFLFARALALCVDVCVCVCVCVCVRACVCNQIKNLLHLKMLFDSSSERFALHLTLCERQIVLPLYICVWMHPFVMRKCSERT